MLQGLKKLTFIKPKTMQPIGDINKQLLWFCESIGLFSSRDKSKSRYRIFIELLKVAKRDIGLSSNELAYRTNLNRATVIFHLKELIASDLVTLKNKKYYLKDRKVKLLIQRLRRDCMKILDEMDAMAEKIDKIIP